MPVEQLDIDVPGGGVRIGRVGFGAARILGGSEKQASVRLIEAALECGVRHFDTAPSYGSGASEQLLGEILGGAPEITVATKVGIEPDNRQPSLRSRIYRSVARPLLAAMPGLKSRLVRSPPVAERVFAERRVLTRDEILKSLERSQKSLRRPIDIYLIHEPQQFENLEELEGWFGELQAEGNFRSFGWGSGGLRPQSLNFGTVEQYIWTPDARPHAEKATILHGVVRGSTSRNDARQRLHHFLERQDCGLLFSASSPAQIYSLLKN